MDNNKYGHHNVPPVGLNGFNKICFTDQKEAENMLLNKALLPGQLTFAYYYDNDSANGVNVMAAVGTLKGEKDNHIFVSYETINQLIDSIDDSLDDYDTSLIYIRKEVMNKLSVLEDEQTKLTNKVDNLLPDMQPKFDEIYTKLESLESAGKEYTDTKVNELTEYINSSVMEKINNYEGTMSDMILDASSKLDNMQKEFEVKAGELLNKHENVYNTLDVSLRNYVDNEMLGMQQFVHSETTQAVIDMNAKYAVLKKAVASINASVNDVDIKHNKKEIELNRTIVETATQLTEDLQIANVSLINYINQQSELFNKRIDKKIDELEFNVKSENIDLTNTVEEYQHNIKNDIAVFNTSMRTFVKSSLATVQTDVNSKYSELKTYVTSNDASLLNYVNALEVAQKTYINKHDSEIKSWIATANTSLFNIVRSTDSKLKDDIDAMDSRHQAMYRSVESRLDNLIDDISTDLNILVNEYNKEIKNFTRKHVSDLENQLKVQNVSLVNYIDDKAQEGVNETRLLNASLRTQLKNTVNLLNTSINNAIQYTDDEISNLKTYVDNENSSIITYVDNQDSKVKLYAELKDKEVKNYIDELEEQLKKYSNEGNSSVVNYIKLTKDNIEEFVKKQDEDTLKKAYIHDDEIRNNMIADYNAFVRKQKDIDASLLNYVKNTDTSLFNYIKNRDEQIKRWIAIGDTSIYNYFESINTSLFNYVTKKDTDLQNTIENTGTK